MKYGVIIFGQLYGRQKFKDKIFRISHIIRLMAFKQIGIDKDNIVIRALSPHNTAKQNPHTYK